VKEAHFRKYPDWKWGSREYKKSTNGEKKLDLDMPSSSDENTDMGPMSGKYELRKVLVSGKFLQLVNLSIECCS